VPTRSADLGISPQTIGPFTILKTLGRGGMGVVYLARDPRANRDVALKVIPAGPDADQTDLARFRTEAEAVARLNHPNIVRLYEVGKTDDAAYLAMEYVDGGTLYRQIKGGRPLEPIDAARLVEQVARAIHYAHQHGVIHRDLKPSNILLSSAEPKMPDSSALTLPIAAQIPKLADFGLAKQLDRSLRLTRTGTAVGTPHYMAPEQARGETAIGPALDIHGLGGILYELLTGVPPFMGDSPAETMEQVVHKTPARPGQLRQGVPPALEAICLKCLEKDPRNRYRSAAALAEDLRRFLQSPEDATRFLHVGDRWFTARTVIPALAVALLLAGTAVLLTAYFSSRVNRSEVDTLRSNAEASIRAERRARLEAAIACCEQGQVGLGLERMRPLESSAELPVAELIAAWQGRVLQPIATLPDLRAAVVAISPHGDLLAAADAERVWFVNAANWSKTGIEARASGAVTALGWSEDGVSLAVGTAEGTACVVDAKTGAVKPVIRQPSGRAIAAIGAAFPGIRVVFAGDTLRQEYVPPLQMRSGNSHPFESGQGPFSVVAIAPMIGDAAVATGTGAVRVYDSMDGRWRDLPPDGNVTALAYSPDGNVLVTGTSAGAVRVWDAVARSTLTESALAGGPVRSVAIGYSATSYTIVVCPENAPAIVLNCARPWVGPPIRLADRPGKEVLGVSLSSDGAKLFVTTPFGVSLWSVRDGKRYGPDRDISSGETFEQPAGPQARFSAGTAGMGDSFVVGGSGGRMFVVDSSDGTTIPKGPGNQEGHEISAVVVGPNGAVASACTHAKGGRTVIRHWRQGMDGDVCESELHTRVHHESFMPGGSAVLLACADGKVRLWDPVANQHHTELDCGSPVLAVAPRPDGKQIVAGCSDGTAQVWDLDSRSRISVFRHRSEVRGVAFHGVSILTASADGTARRWHADSGLPLGPPMSHPDAISGLATWSDLVATGGRGRYVRVWRIK
jgi:serine/threonine protein kinase/WD40 repeat protein